MTTEAARGPFVTLHSPERWPAQRAALKEIVGGKKPLTAVTLARYLHRTSHDEVPAEEFGRTEAMETLDEAVPGFFSTLVPFVAQLALCSEALCPADESSPLRYLPPSVAGTVSLSRLHAASILALAFFDAIGPHAVEDADEWDLPEVPTCRHWLGVGDVYGGNPADEQKCVCLIHFFAEARRTFAHDLSDPAITAAKAAISTATAATAELTTSRLVLPPSVATESAAQSAKEWLKCTTPLLPLTVVESGGIEGAPGALQADFANEYLGGGVLHGGNVQEEIRFSICPECLVSMAFTPRMRPHEAVLLTGIRQYASYSGYGDRFECTGPVVATALPAIGETEEKSKGARRTRRGVAVEAATTTGTAGGGGGEHLIAIDAVPYAFQAGARAQYARDAMLRELTKLRASLGGGGGYDDEKLNVRGAGGDGDEPAAKRKATAGGSTDSPLTPRRAFATGNWGCGVFGGDARLKALLQWMAASHAGREVLYYPFGDPRASGLREAADKLIASGATVGQLAAVLFGAGAEELSNGRAFAVIESKLGLG